jgi:hypothetical protein
VKKCFPNLNSDFGIIKINWKLIFLIQQLISIIVIYNLIYLYCELKCKKKDCLLNYFDERNV